MNTKVWVAVAVVVVVLVGGYFLLYHKSGGLPSYNYSSNNSQSQNTNNPSATTTSTSLKGLLSAGNQTCTFTDGANSGTVYVGDGKARLDMTAVSGGKTNYMYMIIDGQTTYTWIYGQSQGFKSTLSAPASSTTSSTQQIDPNKQADYKCSSWTVDSSKFVLPTDVQFTDMSALTVPHPSMPINGATLPPSNVPSGY